LKSVTIIGILIERMVYMNETILEEVTRRLKAVDIGSGFYVGKCPFCGAFIGFDADGYFCMFCCWRKVSAPMTDVAPALERLRAVVDALIQDALLPGMEGRGSRLLFLTIFGDYVSNNPQVMEPVEKKENEPWLYHVGTLDKLMVKARKTRRILGDRSASR
jgi:hypothetical protein